jgi:hypothetical protein
MEVCPFLNDGDRHCAAFLTMRNLTRAFTFCTDRYLSCPVFQELIVNEPERIDAEAVEICVGAHA